MSSRKAERERMKEATEGLEDCGRGSYGRYTSGCRCKACRAASIAHEREYRRRRAYGRPSYFVDAKPVRERIAKLRDAGYTVEEIGRLSGVARMTIYGITVQSHQTGRPVKRCKREVKDAIFAIRGQRRLTQGQKVDASEILNDLLRWKEAGLTVALIARTAGIDRQVYDAVLHGRQRRVFARTLYRHRMARPGIDRMAGSYLPDAMEVMGV